MSAAALSSTEEGLVAPTGREQYGLTPTGIPCFAERHCSVDAKLQQHHYDTVATSYFTSLAYPHTEEYFAYLDQVLLDDIGPEPLGTLAEICCGRGEAIRLLRGRFTRAVGVDISLSTLEQAQRENPHDDCLFVQGDATSLPPASASFDHVAMFGGIHHVPDRERLFSEVFRILKPGGRFIYREPVSDFMLWRALRWVIYRVSPALDHTTERPLVYEETVPVLERVGLRSTSWKTYGFAFGAILLNSDVLVFNRAFRHLPKIRSLTRLAAAFDDRTLRVPGLARAGLQVVGIATKPASSGLR